MQLAEILNNSNKINNVNDVLNNFDLIVELAKNDIFRIAQSKCIYFNDFDSTYTDAVEILRSQLQKSHLKGIRRFLQCKNVTNAVSWLIERLLNNMRNITTNQKYKLHCAPLFLELHDNIVDSYDVYNKLELEDLHKFNGSIIKKGLQKVWKDSRYDIDFDQQDFEDLCKKFNIEVTDVIDEEELEQPKFSVLQVDCCNKQLVMCF